MKKKFDDVQIAVLHSIIATDVDYQTMGYVSTIYARQCEPEIRLNALTEIRKNIGEEKYQKCLKVFQKQPADQVNA
jgi:hypothetical protein